SSVFHLHKWLGLEEKSSALTCRRRCLRGSRSAHRRLESRRKSSLAFVRKTHLVSSRSPGQLISLYCSLWSMKFPRARLSLLDSPSPSQREQISSLPNPRATSPPRTLRAPFALPRN